MTSSTDASMSKASVDALADLHGAIASELTRRIKENEASAADIGAAIKFLKDNSITADVENNEQLQSLRDKLEEKARRRRLRVVRPATDDPVSDAEATAIIEGIARTA